MEPKEQKTITIDNVITCDNEILSGTPVFKSTRVTVKNLIDYLEAGDSLDEFLNDFPSVSRDQAIQTLGTSKGNADNTRLCEFSLMNLYFKNKKGSCLH